MSFANRCREITSSYDFQAIVWHRYALTQVAITVHNVISVEQCLNSVLLSIFLFYLGLPNFWGRGFSAKTNCREK